MKHYTSHILAISMLLLSACTDSSDEDKPQCNPETESCEPGSAPGCTNDTWKCDENTLSKCISGKWEIINTCEGNTQCSTETKSCEPIGSAACTNDTWACDGNKLSKCESGKWEVIQTCPDHAQCDAEKGLCEIAGPECTNDTWKCDENTLSKCVAEKWKVTQTCEEPAQCNAETGSCEVTCKDTEHLFAGKCEADDVTHCGTHTNDCTKMSGWKSGDCFGKKCFAEECVPGHHLASTFDNNEERTVCEEDTHDACGSVNTKCGEEEICTQGKCKDTCQPGEVICDGSCINPNTSKKFCDADASCSSFIPCSEFEECIDGKCVLSSCQDEAESLCNGDDQNICVNVHGGNPNHCGACGATCSDKETAKVSGCAQGQCTYTCNEGMVNCGSDTEPMCLPEEQLKSDPTHCGQCDTKCADNELCQDGKCIVSECTGNECLYNNACVNQDEHC
ncbi:MAG: hypothetical protein IJ268_01865, partial [Proteobacteria bacterium]|nr:hypothetical protein [Pseudomonadota bacterium]